MACNKRIRVRVAVPDTAYDYLYLRNVIKRSTECLLKGGAVSDWECEDIVEALRSSKLYLDPPCLPILEEIAERLRATLRKIGDETQPTSLR